MVEKEIAIAVCPELLAWLPIPRILCEGGCEGVIGKGWKEYTEVFQLGAKKTLEIAQKNNIHKAILKDKNPSCWCGYIYDKTFD